MMWKEDFHAILEDISATFYRDAVTTENSCFRTSEF